MQDGGQKHPQVSNLLASRASLLINIHKNSITVKQRALGLIEFSLQNEGEREGQNSESLPIRDLQSTHSSSLLPPVPLWVFTRVGGKSLKVISTNPPPAAPQKCLPI